MQVKHWPPDHEIIWHVQHEIFTLGLPSYFLRFGMTGPIWHPPQSHRNETVRYDWSPAGYLFQSHSSGLSSTTRTCFHRPARVKRPALTPTGVPFAPTFGPGLYLSLGIQSYVLRRYLDPPGTCISSLQSPYLTRYDWIPRVCPFQNSIHIDSLPIQCWSLVSRPRDPVYEAGSVGSPTAGQGSMCLGVLFSRHLDPPQPPQSHLLRRYLDL